MTPSDAFPSTHQLHAPGADAAIVRAAIHPAIGVARMGNSQHDFYVGPEVTEPLPQPPGRMHDAAGALKRQAARFRVYGYDAAGNVVRELTTHDADLRWTVHVANRKASWYQWAIALDIPEAAGNTLPLRNATVGDRASLEIAPGPRSITGAWEGGPAYAPWAQGYYSRWSGSDMLSGMLIGSMLFGGMGPMFGGMGMGMGDGFGGGVDGVGDGGIGEGFGVGGLDPGGFTGFGDGGGDGGGFGDMFGGFFDN